MLVPLQGVAACLWQRAPAKCLCDLRFGIWCYCRVPLQSVALQSARWGVCAGVAAGCRCTLSQWPCVVAVRLSFPKTSALGFYMKWFIWSEMLDIPWKMKPKTKPLSGMLACVSLLELES